MGLTPKQQVREVRRVIEALHDASGSIHGPLIDEVRRSTGDWLEAALDGRLDPDNARMTYSDSESPKAPWWWKFVSRET